MKQYLFFATAIATASLFTGCSNNEFVGDQPEALNSTDGAIAFSMGKANTTRTEASKPANDFFEHFYVYGEKTVNDVPTKVFDTYKVQYKVSSDHPSASNTSNWEYVISDGLWESSEKENVGGGVDKQTIKYWDYSASKYTFYAFSANLENVKDAQNPKIKVERKSVESGGYTYDVTIKKGADIEKLYFADKKVVDKNSYAGKDATAETGAVKLTFRNLASKIRVGFYETVPGYKINITKMYSENAAITTETKESTTNFLAECNNTVASQDSKIRVTYNTGEGDTKNRAEVSEKNTSEAKILTLGGNLFKKDGAVNYLATTSSSPTWDKSDAGYTFFWPQTGNDAPLKIKVDYKLTSLDGSNEEINVTGATATVPADYVQWAANTAYTYIFKISDNTNGTTGEGGPEGLYPITFDAVVVDYANEGSITTVSTPSVTAKQDGITNVDGTTNDYVSVNDNGIVFQTGKTIELKVMKEDELVTNPVITGGYIEGATYNYDLTPDQNLAGSIDASIENIGTTNANKILPAQNTPGYWVLKVAVSSTSGAAFTYVIIRVGSAEEGPANQ